MQGSNQFNEWWDSPPAGGAGGTAAALDAATSDDDDDEDGDPVKAKIRKRMKVRDYALCIPCRVYEYSVERMKVRDHAL
jgi:hypothetical protein